MQITINVTKDGDKFKAKFGTSKGGGQERIRDAELSEIGDKLVKILEKANGEGYIGKK